MQKTRHAGGKTRKTTGLHREIAVPFDKFIQKLYYESKFIKYLELCDAINDLGVYCRIVVLIVGPTWEICERPKDIRIEVARG